MVEARIRLTKGAAVANVLPEHVETWKAQGWRDKKPRVKFKPEPKPKAVKDVGPADSE